MCEDQYARRRWWQQQKIVPKIPGNDGLGCPVEGAHIVLKGTVRNEIMKRCTGRTQDWVILSYYASSSDSVLFA